MKNSSFINLYGLILIIFLAFSCSEDEPIILTQEQKIAGSWGGIVTQEGYGDYVLNVTLSEFVLGSQVGTGDYDQECDFTWTYTGNEGAKYIIEEKIVSGLDFCIDGTIKMTVLNDNALKFVWTGSDSDDNFANGTLARK